MQHIVSDLALLKLDIRILSFLKLCYLSLRAANGYSIRTILNCFYAYVVSHLFRRGVDKLFSLYLFSNIGLLVWIFNITQVYISAILFIVLNLNN
jgi:hypothetical protein